MSGAPRTRPAAVVRGKALADRVRGRDLLFKASNYMGPVHVAEASCSYRWFRLNMTTQPWWEGVPPRVLVWEVPPTAVTETPVRLSVRVHHLVGMLIHDRGSGRIRENSPSRAGEMPRRQMKNERRRPQGTARGVWRQVKHCCADLPELATPQWVRWFHRTRLLEPIGYTPPAEAEAT